MVWVGIFLYVGGSSLLVSLVKPEEQGKVQGVADFIIIGSVAFSSLSAGFIHYFIGWDKMVLGILPFILIILISNIDDIWKGFLQSNKNNNFKNFHYIDIRNKLNTIYSKKGYI